MPTIDPSLASLLGKAPPVTLLIGIVLGVIGVPVVRTKPWNDGAKKYSRVLIQCSIVLLGFWISLADVARAGLSGIAFSTGAILLVMLVSPILSRLIGTERDSATLLCAGTSICGGSAIAATGAALNVAAGTMAAATAIVFLLNAIGVYAYPAIGHAVGLTDRQFGAWCAVGVHDVAGVVAAARSWNDAALADATVIKLTRVLWIVPVAMFLRATSRQPDVAASAARTPFPWFIVFFVAACLLRATLDRAAGTDATAPIADWGKLIATILLSIALFLIGTGLTRATLAVLGWKPALHGTLLWLINSAAALAAARAWL